MTWGQFETGCDECYIKDLWIKLEGGLIQNGVYYNIVWIPISLGRKKDWAIQSCIQYINLFLLLNQNTDN